MIERPSHNFRWRGRPQSLVRLSLLALLFLASAPFSRATGYYGPTVYLEEGGRRVSESPEFYWELEVKRLARDFHPPEKFVHEGRADIYSETSREEKEKPLADRTAKADIDDFAAALREGLIKPPDPAQASTQHQAARDAIQNGSGNLPAEFPSEFADYHRGAFAPSAEEALKIWETLLARPPEERKYRSVWAAFMIGKRLLKAGDPKAAEWFRRTRELAANGFHDSLGLAADSYGWEGRSEWKQGHPEKAAPLFLSQLALGDESAVVSLKALIPDRDPVEGYLNYGPEAEERNAWDEATKNAREEKEQTELKAAAHDPLRRRLVTMHILATQADPYLSEDTGNPGVKRAARWLAAVEAANKGKIEDAEYLGWIAYGDGKYDQAARWLGLTSGETPAALWLKSKLQKRAGKLDEAARTMARAWEVVRDRQAYTGWKEPEEGQEGNYPRDNGRWNFEASASGDLGGLRLARTEFVGALDAFVKGQLWSDAAFIAERVLTADELKKYVDEQPASTDESDKAAGRLRYLLGRRLVREDRYAEAAKYLPPPNDKILERYLKALKDAGDAALPKEQRARAYFTAGWIARYDGMELMGTEGAPDGFISEGSFAEPDIAQERQSGLYLQTSYGPDGEKQKRLPISLKPTAKEKARLTTQKIRPDVRFHYRVIAAALAVRAAELLPDNSEELADALNQAGRWVQNRDDKAADRYFLVLKKRGARTEIGRAALAKRWFVDQSGPWSGEEQAARDAANPAATPSPDE